MTSFFAYLFISFGLFFVTIGVLGLMIIAPTSTHVLAMYAKLYEKKTEGEKLSNHL